MKKLRYSEVNLELNQRSKMEFFAKIVNGFQQLVIFAKGSNLDVLLGSELNLLYDWHKLLSNLFLVINCLCDLIGSRDIKILSISRNLLFRRDL